MQTQLEIIRDILKNYTAFSFAEKKLQAERDSPNRDYFTYMRNSYSGKDNPTIEECEENAKRQFISEYSKCCQLLTGWQFNGSVFILDRRNKFVLFLYHKDNSAHKAVTHYNPLEYDCYEWGMSNERFFEGLKKGEFDLSTNENELIKECDVLITGS